jgi:hypothetical protein
MIKVTRRHNKGKNFPDKGAHNAALDWEFQKNLRERNRRAKITKRQARDAAKRAQKEAKRKGIFGV